MAKDLYSGYYEKLVIELTWGEVLDYEDIIHLGFTVTTRKEDWNRGDASIKVQDWYTYLWRVTKSEGYLLEVTSSETAYGEKWRIVYAVAGGLPASVTDQTVREILKREIYAEQKKLFWDSEVRPAVSVEIIAAEGNLSGGGASDSGVVTDTMKDRNAIDTTVIRKGADAVLDAAGSVIPSELVEILKLTAIVAAIGGITIGAIFLYKAVKE